MEWRDLFRGIAAIIGIMIADVIWQALGFKSHLTFNEAFQLALAMIIVSAIREKKDA